MARTPLFYSPYYRFHLPWPSQILIENTNCCNAQCVMCPRDTLTRKRGFMEFGLFEKIMTELSGARRKPVVHLHGFGEPLLDPLLPERIKLAKACGIKQTYMVTNASLLFPETARSLILAGLDAMKISFYGTDEASYNATMRQLDFKVALQNIKDFMRIRKELKKSNPKLVLQYLPQENNGSQIAEFQSLWRSLPDKNRGDCLNISSLDNFGGGKSYNTVGEKIVSVCFYPWSALSVLWDGKAVTCCVDYNGAQGVGDVNTQSIREIWNGPVLSTIRKNFGKLDYSGFPTCQLCDWVHRR
ncbi:radical SAM/SPASM domain-containing protein [Desulfobulbus sp.]|uniref:radical SAM/SPASM domain-containing protein n=1 Tax=Desulfobulbus sp. TaxID=895 RepID=UPI0027BB1550|nr:radical SAM/SPASM domain-containing protein [Desulfobulbus sp.]